jgi:DNA-binding NarL/FixJ family response regulator
MPVRRATNGFFWKTFLVAGRCGIHDISGTERLAAKNPRMKVLFMSGCIGDAIVRSGIQNQDVAFLQKPLAPITLVRKVREVLDGTRVGEA